MRLSVTGASGFLGRRVVARALAAGHAVRVLARPGAVPPPAGVEMVEGRLEDGAALDALLRGADAVVHLAVLGVRSRDRDWRTAVRVNTVGTADLIDHAARSGIRRAVLAGSWIEYAGRGRLPYAPWRGPAAAPACVEESTVEPADPYGASKASGGIIARSHARATGLECWYLRLASMFGPDDYPEKLLPGAIEAAVRGTEFRMTGGEQVRDWLHVEDAAAAVVTAAETAPPAGVEVLNVGTGEGVAIHALVDRIYRVTGGDPERVRRGALPYRPHEPHHLVLDASKARRLLDWRPLRSSPGDIDALARAALRARRGEDHP